LVAFCEWIISSEKSLGCRVAYFAHIRRD